MEGRAVDASGNVYMTVEELMKQEAERRAGELTASRGTGTTLAPEATSVLSMCRSPYRALHADM